jgi:hypothetical protein
MKHLKKYNENKLHKGFDLEEILDTIDDMFLYSKDNGFKLDYSGQLLKLIITKPLNNRGFTIDTLFLMSDVLDTIQMIMNYLDGFSEFIVLNNILFIYKSSNTISSEYVDRDDLDKVEADLFSIHIKYEELQK